MLRTEDVTLGYALKNVVCDLSLGIKKGDLTTIIGANGSGKSTILKALSRNLKPVKGCIYLDGKLIHKTDTKQVAKKLTMLPQNPVVPNDFKVRDLVGYGRYPHLGFTNRLKQEDIEIIDWAIEAVALNELQHRFVCTLSGGERQMAWIALALAQKPQILLLDEPTTFLDIAHQFDVLDMVKSLNEDFGITVVMILHDINQAARYSQEIVVLKDGRIFKKGTPEEIVCANVIEKVFNIKARVYFDEDNNCPYFITLGKK